MSLKKLKVLEKVSEIAALAGMKGEIDEDIMEFVTGAQTKEGRGQIVKVRPSPEAVQDDDVVTFYSPCLIVKKGMLSGISKKQALDLLARNESTMLFGRFGIWQGKDEDWIVVSVDQLLSTLDPKEFESHVYSVAFSADRYEEEHGRDDF